MPVSKNRNVGGLESRMERQLARLRHHGARTPAVHYSLMHTRIRKPLCPLHVFWYKVAQESLPFLPRSEQPRNSILPECRMR
jgi:hypothetical protein